MPSSFAKPWLRGNRQQRFQIFHSKISLSHKNFLFGKILMMSFHVICGLGFPQSKILGTPMNWRSPKKIFLKTFFLENACACVLGLGLEHFCPWPREVLSLERLSLALASSLVSSTPPLVSTFSRSKVIAFSNSIA